MLSILLGIQIPVKTKIGKGFSIKHFSNIVIAQSVVVGENVTIHQGVTLGWSFGGEREGCPVIGDNVVIFPGAKIIGNIKIGNNVIIGANAVVLRDVPAGCVVAGNPARIISNDSKHCTSDKWKSYLYGYY